MPNTFNHQPAQRTCCKTTSALYQLSNFYVRSSHVKRLWTHVEHFASNAIGAELVIVLRIYCIAEMYAEPTYLKRKLRLSV